MKNLRFLLLALASLVLVGCFDVESYVDLSDRAKPGLLLRVTWPEDSALRKRAEEGLARAFARHSTNYGSLKVKSIASAGLKGVEFEGIVDAETRTRFAGTPLSPRFDGNRLEIDLPLKALGVPEERRAVRKSNDVLDGRTFRLSFRGAGTPQSAVLVAGGSFRSLRMSSLKDLTTLEVPLSILAQTWDRATIRVDFKKATPEDSDAAVRRGAELENGIALFENGDNLGAHGVFARLHHEHRYASPDLFVHFGMTSLAVDKDPKAALGFYLTAIDAFKKTESRFPWQKNEDRAYFLLGRLYGDTNSRLFDRKLAKAAFDAGLKVNPSNAFILPTYERITGTKR